MRKTLVALFETVSAVLVIQSVFATDFRYGQISWTTPRQHQVNVTKKSRTARVEMPSDSSTSVVAGPWPTCRARGAGACPASRCDLGDHRQYRVQLG